MLRLPTILIALATCPGLLAGPAVAGFDPVADRLPLVLTGDEVPGLLGTPVAEIWAYRYDASTGSFSQVPLQVDERTLYDLTQGQTTPVYELTYDWFGVDDGLLDGDDEIALMARDAGDRAPDTDVWVPGADDVRVELRITDPLSSDVGWLYLFTSSTLADDLPGFSYVTYSAPDPVSGIADVDTATYSIGYDGRWLLTRLEVKPGPDVLDRVKVRGYALVGSQTENTYDNTSELLGGRAGKVRALREVQGAASGPLTTHLDLFYADTWRRTTNLRVHPMPAIWTYLDYLPPPGAARFFSSMELAGLPIDGANDAPPGLSLPAWGQASLPDATLVFVARERTGFPFPDPGAPCAPVAGISFYWRDDAAFDDLSGDDTAAYGNHGVHLQCTADTNAAPYTMTQQHHFLPPQATHAPVGGAYAQREDGPLQVAAQDQVRATLADARLDRVVRAGGGLLDLLWTDALGEDSYEVYRGALTAPFSYSHDTALVCGLPAETVSWTTGTDQETGQPSYYYLVVPRRGGLRDYGTDGSGAPRPPSGAPCP